MDFMKQILLALGTIGLFVVCLTGLSVIGAIIALATGIDLVAMGTLALGLAVAITVRVR